NGDGFDDIISGAGAGGGPHVQVFSGADRSVLQSFFATNVNFTGGIRVAAQDRDGDGLADIVTSLGKTGAPTVTIRKGTNLAQLSSISAFDPSFLGGVFVG